MEGHWPPNGLLLGQGVAVAGPQPGTGPQPAHGPPNGHPQPVAGGPQGPGPQSAVQDFSPQWIDYYRSQGMLAEAEKIEQQVKAAKVSQ